MHHRVTLQWSLDIAIDGHMVTGAVALVPDLALESFGGDAFREDEGVEPPSDAFGSAEASPAVEGVVSDGIGMLLPPDVDERL